MLIRITYLTILSMKRLFKIYRHVLYFFALPIFVSSFFRPAVGKEYDVGFWKKISLVRSFRKTIRSIPSASDWLEHLAMAERILLIPRSVEGGVIECGAYKGASTANLSRACVLTGRTLYVADSFEGLPEPVEEDRYHLQEVKGKHKEYRKGDYAGAFEEVKQNIRRHGDIQCCEFIRGYYENTLAGLKDKKLVFVFLDVDLNDSLKTCCKYLWVGLEGGCFLFSHEAQDLAFVSHFFNQAWWQEHLKTDAPGFIGAGTGLPLGIAYGSAIGYTVKK